MIATKHNKLFTYALELLHSDSEDSDNQLKLLLLNKINVNMLKTNNEGNNNNNNNNKMNRIAKPLPVSPSTTPIGSPHLATNSSSSLFRTTLQNNLQAALLNGNRRTCILIRHKSSRLISIDPYYRNS